MYILFSIITLFISLFSINVSARIEYAAKHRINRCTACHVSPVGGSLRTVQGKAYGQYGFAAGPYSGQDMFSADVRMIYYKPEDNHNNKGGLGIMNGQFGLNVPIMEKNKFPYEVRLAYAQNIGGFGGTSPRNAYLRWKFNEDTEVSVLPQYVLLGRFHAPFGILSDEHRTYVRMQNNTTWNNFEMGALFSANPFEAIHYDIALVNGEKTSGASFGTDQSNNWGAILNLRYAPAWLPTFIGTSFSRHSAATDVANLNNFNPQSIAYYAVIPLQRISRWLPLTLSYERQESENWNEDSAFSAYLSPTSGYGATVAQSKSIGELLRIEFQVTQKLNLIYQYDSLLLNKDFTGDTYVRQGYGVRWAIGPNMLLNLRQELAQGGSNVEDVKSTRAKQDAFWMVLQVGI